MDELRPYHVDVFFSSEDECWIAAVPDWQNCNAHGTSPEEAVNELQVAAKLWFEVWMEKHDAPPPVKYVGAAPPMPQAKAG